MKFGMLISHSLKVANFGHYNLLRSKTGLFDRKFVRDPGCHMSELTNFSVVVFEETPVFE